MRISAAEMGMPVPNTKGQTANDGDVLDKQAFLELLVTQLRYQNPIEPMGNEELLSQSAQFSSLEQLQDMNKSVQALIEVQESSSRAAALNLIGRHVIIEDSTISLSDMSPVELHYSLSEKANVTITIYDDDGNFMATIEAGEHEAGEYALVWDGLNNEGIRIPDGEYIYEVSAVDANGREVEASETVSGIVDSITFGSEPLISIGDLQAPLRAVTEVSSVSAGD